MHYAVYGIWNGITMIDCNYGNDVKQNMQQTEKAKFQKQHLLILDLIDGIVESQKQHDHCANDFFTKY